MSMEEGANRIVGQCLGLRSGESLLIITDAAKREVGESIFNAAERIGAMPIMTVIPASDKPFREPPEALGRFMMECDAIVLTTSFSMTHTKARVRASKSGARIVSLPGVTEDMMSKGGITADFKEIERVLRRIQRKIRNTSKVHLISSSGSDVTFSVKKREWITKDNGLASHKGDMTTLPAGELFISPVEGSAEGRLVFDIRLLDELEQPASVLLKEGYVSRVIGGKSAVAEMNKGGKDGRNLAKFGIGLNPQARPRSHIIEAQKALGAIHIVFGDSLSYGGLVQCPVKVDGILSDATVEIDNKTIIERGKLLI